MAAGQFGSDQRARVRGRFSEKVHRPRPRRSRAYQLSQIKFDHTDIRFTTKGDTLYAIALGWPPDNQVLIKSLASTAPHYERQIRKVELLGAKERRQVDERAGWTEDLGSARVRPAITPIASRYCRLDDKGEPSIRVRSISTLAGNLVCLRADLWRKRLDTTALLRRERRVKYTGDGVWIAIY